jgi:hypothetical protein
MKKLEFDFLDDGSIVARSFDEGGWTHRVFNNISLESIVALIKNFPPSEWKRGYDVDAVNAG